MELPFPLLSDPPKDVIPLYDVARRIPFIPNKRFLYVIDKAGVIRGVFHHQIAFGPHENDVLEALRALNVDR